MTAIIKHSLEKGHHSMIMLNRITNHKLLLMVHQEETVNPTRHLAWEINICKIEDNKKNQWQLLGQVKVEHRNKIENKDGITKITKLNNNTKENHNMKTSGKLDKTHLINRRILDTQENKTLNKINKKIHGIQESKILNQTNIKENLKILSKTTSMKGNLKTKNNQTSIKGILSLNNKSNTKEKLKIKTNLNQVRNKPRDRWQVLAHLLLSSILEIHQVANHKLYSDNLLVKC